MKDAEYALEDIFFRIKKRLVLTDKPLLLFMKQK